MRESSRTPATATTTTSHHPACTGFPPRRTRRASTGRRTGSVTLRRVRPNLPNGDTRRVRTSQPASATRAARQKVANIRIRRIVCTSYMVSTYKRRGEWGVVRDTPKAWGVGSGTRRCAADTRIALSGTTLHSPLPTSFRCKDVDPVRLGEPRAGAAPDGVDQAARGGRGEVITRRGDRGGVLPAIRRGVVDRRGVEQHPSHAPPAHHDELAVHDSHARCAPRLRERCARLPAVPVLTVDP